MGQQSGLDNFMAKVVMYVIVGGVVLLIVLWLLFSFAAIIAAVAIVVLFFVNLVRYLAQDRKGRATNFWLTESEKQQYVEVVNILAHSERERNEVKNIVDSKGIPRNQDGQISQRSYEGKGLRERENRANARINDYYPVYTELQSRPQARWKKARVHYSRAFGFGFIILVIAALCGIAHLRGDASGTPPKGEALFSASTHGATDSATVAAQPAEATQQAEATQPGKAEKPAGGQAKDTELTDFLKALAAALGISIGLMAAVIGAVALMWLIGWLVGRARFGLKNPKPPLVSMDNVYDYADGFANDKKRKEAERLRRKEEQRQRRELQRKARQQAKTGKGIEAGSAEGKEPDGDETAGNSAAALAASAPAESDAPQRSAEESLFASWAASLRNGGYKLTGNWENWENCGPWKNLAVVSSVNGVGIRIIVEYYVKSKKVYFGIAKLNDEDNISQELLDSEAFRNIMAENGLTVKNNGSWYCLKFSTFGNVFQEYRHLISNVKPGLE